MFGRSHLASAHLAGSRRAARPVGWIALAVCAWLAFASAGMAEIITGTFAGPILSGSTATLVDGASIVGDVSNDGTLEFAMSTNLVVPYSIYGSGNVLLSGTSGTGGTITFSGSNSYSGGTIVQFGELLIPIGGSVSHAGANLFVGDLAGDVGFLTISGGSVSSLDGTLGYNPGSTGTAEISSGTWSMAGDFNVAYAGTGTFTMTDGAVSVGGSAIVGRDAGSLGTFLISGGTMSVVSALAVGYGGSVLSPGSGSLTMTGGLITSEDGYIGYNSSSSGTVSITSGTWAMSRDLKIAPFGGTGVLDINAGGVVSVGGELSRDISLGTLNLNSGGTLVIGVGGTTGALSTDIVNNGTLVFDRSTNYQHDYVISGSGSVVKRGSGTLTLTQINDYSGGTTILGGTLAVAAVATINHPSATMVIGSAAGDVGGLVVGGSVLSSTLDLYNGSFDVTAGGYVESGSATVGLVGSGTATIGNGTWNVLNDLAIGASGGTGRLDITGAGSFVFTGGNTTLGAAAGDSGTITVTDNGTWNSSGNVAVGVGGIGALTISSTDATGGSVLVTGTLSQGTFGTITINPAGTLTIGNGGATGALAATSVTNDGLIVFNRSTDASSPTSISGVGGVTKQGAAALTLTGSSSYTGATNVEAGTLYVDGQLGATTVSVFPGAVLGGSGSVAGPVIVTSGTLTPGSPSSPFGTLTVGSLVLDAGLDDATNKMTTIMTVSGTVPGVSYDQIAAFDPAEAPIVYGGAFDLTMTANFDNYTTFHLFSNFSAVSGEFSEIVLHAAGTAYDGLLFVFNPDTKTYETDWTQPVDGQKLVFSLATGDLVVVPEPTTVALAAVGIVMACTARWRQQKSRKAASRGGDSQT